MAKAEIVWRPEVVGISVVLVNAPADFVATTLAGKVLTRRVAGERLASNRRHLHIEDAGGSHHVWLIEASSGASLAALVPLDDTASLRIAGLRRFHRLIDGQKSGRMPSAWQLTPRLRRRLVLMIRALDALPAKASYRDMALVFYGPAAVSRDPWKTSSLRGQTIRLVKDAISIRDGGYRQLLKGGTGTGRG
ncbi:hypothetical protein SAMN02745126_06334 [Enhydrobacter aerosaccus]|uniref:T6SS Transcription factor RovC-like DNA binding domain-containing protein n=1 Tax=Enhydrobacter aerosaccus TaxID=225324 RepID=A0A1T4TIS1_9HYPH|nr:DUF2285 domain-containing protein [Enhydrobacter aerosaccus]SKA40342.1 hypothetical protein SAMN02745126_06334 [Enhydrobacter aerosaccus]